MYPVQKIQYPPHPYLQRGTITSFPARKHGKRNGAIISPRLPKLERRQVEMEWDACP